MSIDELYLTAPVYALPVSFSLPLFFFEIIFHCDRWGQLVWIVSTCESVMEKFPFIAPHAETCRAQQQTPVY